MVKKLMLLVLVFSMLSCTSTLKNASQLYRNDTVFEIPPHLEVEAGDVVLRYKIKKVDGQIQNRWQIGFSVKDGKCYYYFVGQSAFREYNEIVSINLVQDGVVEYVKGDALFWLNPDGSSDSLRVTE